MSANFYFLLPTGPPGEGDAGDVVRPPVAPPHHGKTVELFVVHLVKQKINNLPSTPNQCETLEFFFVHLEISPSPMSVQFNRVVRYLHINTELQTNPLLKQLN